MKRLFTICLLFAACNSQTRADLEKEYEQVLKESAVVQDGIDLQSKAVESAAMTGYTEGVVYFTKLVDSLQIRKAALDKRREELARQLYK
jgi:hypothetical protein